MLLASNVFESVVDSLESGAQRGGHRREPRVLLSTRLTILPCPNGPEAGLGVPLSVPVRDLSRGGLRFLLPRRLPLDTQFIALFPARLSEVSGPVGPVGPGAAPSEPAPDTEQPMAVLCSVAYWQPLAKDLFAIGGQFLKPLPNFQAPALTPRVVLPGEVEGESLGVIVPLPQPPADVQPSAAPAAPAAAIVGARRIAS